MAVDKLVDSQQLDGAITATANAIRTKTGSGDSIEWDAETGFAREVGRMDEWHCPAGWPDLESLQIPKSDETNTIYILYDKKCGYDTVFISTRHEANVYPTIYKGRIESGQFIGEEIDTTKNVYNTEVHDTLNEEWTVYKITGVFSKFSFPYGITNNYTLTVQSVAWIYGNAPCITALGGSAEAEAFASIHTRRFKLYNTIQKSLSLTLSDSYKYNTINPSAYWLGVTENGDYDGATISRYGNGPVHFGDAYKDTTLTIKNAEVEILVGRFSNFSHLRFEGVTGTMANQGFQNSPILSIEFVDCDVSCTSMYYQFYSAYWLQYCDLSEVDFSQTINSSNAFAGCYSLRTLKLNATWAIDLNINACYRLTKESILDIFRVLPTLTETQTITLPYGMKNYILSADEIAIATEKGWTVA